MMKGKTILITGGGSGIGEALALQLAVHNKVVICGRSEEKLKAVTEKNKVILYETMDVSDPVSIDAMFERWRQKETVFDAVINNAGVVELWDLSIKSLSSNEIFEKVNTNLSGAVAVTQAFIRQADRSNENLIVNITSEIALFPIPVLPLYAASKAGLRVFTQSLRRQLKNTRFTVIEILPPAVDTAMPRQLNNTGKLLNPAVFAANIIKSIERGKTEYAPGSNVMLFKLFSKFLPATGLRLIDIMSRKQLLGK